MAARASRRLATGVRGTLRDALVLLTFLPPFRRLLGFAYGLVLGRLTRSLAARPYVDEVGLTGSLAAGDCLYGASDIDLIVIAEGRPDPSIRREIRSFFRWARRLFPLVGDVDERTGNLFFRSEIGVSPWPAIYTCRRKARSYRTLAGGRPEAAAAGASFTPVEVLAEITLQLKSIAAQATAGPLSLYFWKSKIRVLDHLLSQTSPAASAESRRLDAQEEALLRQLRETPNRRLHFRRRAELDELAWSIVQKLVTALVAEHGLESLETATVAYQATPARQLPVEERELPAGVRLHEYARRGESFGGDSPLNAPVLPHLLLAVDDPSWATFRRACEFAADGRADAALVFVWLRDFVVQFHGARCQGVLSRYERPHLFPSSFEHDGRLRYPSVFLASLLAERDADLDHLRDAFYWRIVDRASSADPAREGESLRYFEERQRCLDGFAFVHLAGCQSPDRIVNFGSRDRVFEHAAGEHSEQGPMLTLLRQYARLVAEGSLARSGTGLPPALMRASTRFFTDVLYERSTAGDYASDARLTLSLCVCTRNRAAYLAQLLDSVEAQTRRPDEIVIVDNGSTDATPSVVAGFGSKLPLRYVVDHSDTLGRLRNRALAEATGEIVCFTDDDCVLDEGWLHFIEESFFLEEQIAIVGGQVLHLEQGDSLVDRFHRAYLGVRL